MSTESVKILIEADDLASPKIKNVAKTTDQVVKQVQDVGKRTKASSEFLGQLANVLGGTELGQFAGQVGQVTEKVSQFGEVAKVGRAGALLFKAGLVSAVGALSFNAAKPLGDWLWGIDKLEKAYRKTEEAALDLIRRTQELREKTANIEREEFEAIFDPVERDKAAKAKIQLLERELKGARISVAEAERVKNEADRFSFNPDRRQVTLMREQAAIQLDEAKSGLEFLLRQKDAWQEIVSPRRQALELQIRENEARTSSQNYLQGLREEIELLNAKGDELNAILAARNAVEADRGEAARLLKSIELLKQRNALEAERQKLRDERNEFTPAERLAKLIDDQQGKVNDVAKAEWERLRLALVEIEQGQQAAQAMRLEMLGVRKEEAMAIAAEQARIEALRKAKADEEAKKQAIKQEPQTLQAVQSRLLRRAPQQDEAMQKLLTKQAEAAKQREEQKKLLAQLAIELRRVRPINFVGVN